MGQVIGILKPSPRQSFRVWYRHVLSWLRFYRTALLLNFVEPFTILLALGIGLGSYIHLIAGMKFVQFVAPGLLAVTAMNAVTFDSLFAAHYHLTETRVYPSMISAPLTVDDVVGGILLWEATRCLGFGLIFLALLLALGLVHSFFALLILPLLVLTGIMFAVPALCVSGLVKAFDQIFYYITLFVTPMFMFSGIFFPPSRLPHAVQWAIWVTPLFHVANLTRNLVLGTVTGSLWIDLLWMLVFTAVALLFPLPIIKRKLLV
jgi:lipooligosaccharide transport system permease protein